MRFTFVAILIAVMADAPTCGPKPTTADLQFRALRDEYQAAFEAFVKANREAKTPADEAKVRDHPGRNPRAFAPAFMDLADKYPRTAAAEEALLWIASHTFQTELCEESKRRLARDFVGSEKLGAALGFQGHYADYFEGSERFFRKIVAENPHREIQGLACYWLARHLLHKAEGVRAAKKNTGLGQVGKVDIYREVYGADWADRLRRLDAESLDREADALFQRWRNPTPMSHTTTSDATQDPWATRLARTCASIKNWRSAISPLKSKGSISTATNSGCPITEARWWSLTSVATSIAVRVASSIRPCKA